MCPNHDNTTANIINVQHFSLDDGPGIRTTVFLKGCPLRCAWCHNPESQNPHPELMWRTDKCIGCALCLSECPSGAHKTEDGSHIIDRDLCKACGSCAKTCIAKALEMAGEVKTLSEVMEEILLDSVFYQRSGGGVTVSGGEPLMQADFTFELLSMCRKNGIHTCIETCGYGNSEDVMKIAEFTDLFLFDYKLTDSAQHKRYTGADNTLILKNLDLICRTGAKVILRCPMIPDVNLHTAHYDGIAELSKLYTNIIQIQLEPYHPLGIGKSLALGRQPQYIRSEFLEKEALNAARTYISKKVSVEVKIV